MSHWDIEISEKMYEIISSIFQTLELPVPKSITAKEMEKVLIQMNSMIQSNQDKKSNGNLQVVNNKIKAVKRNNTVLVIAKLGIIRYQLKIVLNNINCEVVAIEDKYAGLAEYVKKLYDFVVIDVSDNIDDSIEVIKEIKRVATNYSKSTSLVALTIPDFDSTINQRLNAKGVEIIIDKTDNWYEQVVKEINHRSYLIKR